MVSLNQALDEVTRKRLESTVIAAFQKVTGSQPTVRIIATAGYKGVDGIIITVKGGYGEESSQNFVQQYILHHGEHEIEHTGVGVAAAPNTGCVADKVLDSLELAAKTLGVATLRKGDMSHLTPEQRVFWVSRGYEWKPEVAGGLPGVSCGYWVKQIGSI